MQGLYLRIWYFTVQLLSKSSFSSFDSVRQRLHDLVSYAHMKRCKPLYSKYCHLPHSIRPVVQTFTATSSYATYREANHPHFIIFPLVRRKVNYGSFLPTCFHIPSHKVPPLPIVHILISYNYSTSSVYTKNSFSNSTLIGSWASY